jgi:serpin B
MSTERLSRRRFLALSGAAGAVALCPTLARADRPPVTALGKLVAGNSAFGLDLFRKLATGKQSVFFSPFSISAALAMTSAGAKGKTLDEMRTVLRLPDEAHPTFGKLLGFVNGTPEVKRKHELVVANALWGMKGYPWRKDFLELLQKSYRADLSEVDFNNPEPARAQINEWVEKQTKEKIKELIPEGGLTPLTRLVLANAVYFKGNWADKFDKALTQDAPFTHADGTKANVPLMVRAGHYDYAEYAMSDKADDLVQVLGLPYDGDKASLLVFLPKDPAGIGRLAEWLKPKHFASGNLKSRRVDLLLPRFKAESSFSLKDVLVGLGIKAAFDDSTADFTEMHTGKEALYISAVRHKAFVDVNEEGTEAAAATDVEVATKGAPPPEITLFRADRPFMFAIRDETTDCVLFLGRYSGPKA